MASMKLPANLMILNNTIPLLLMRKQTRELGTSKS